MVNIIKATDGSFGSYGYSGPKAERPGSPDQLASDEAAWRAAESVLERFELPSGLERHRIKRNEGTQHTPATAYCYFNPRPHGYQSWVGNTASVLLDQNDGTPITVGISSGWTYEPPNIQVSERQAISKAQEIYGGGESEWESSIMYRVGANQNMPPYMREMAANKVQRLCYSLSRDTQENSYFV
jgi:hypothetical protein